MDGWAVSDIVKRLRIIANLKVGDPMPEWLGPNEWGPALSKLTGEAADEIERLRRAFADILELEILPEKGAMALSTTGGIAYRALNGVR